MTRAPFCQEKPRRGYECEHSFPPWGVPMRRKPRGLNMGRDCNKYYDPTERRLFSSGVGEITTQNRYSPLSELLIEIEIDCTVEYDEGPLQDFGQIHNKRSPRRVHFNDEKNQRKYARDGIECSICMIDDYNAYVYENKINFSSGYFPEYILYPCVDIDNVNSDCITDDINLDLNLDYYPIFFGGKYTKQLSNKYSKYNNQYFSKQYSIYKICKKFWKPQETSPSCRIVADSPRIGTKGDGINNKHLNNNSNNKNMVLSNKFIKGSKNKNSINKGIINNKDKKKE